MKNPFLKESEVVRIAVEQLCFFLISAVTSNPKGWIAPALVYSVTGTLRAIDWESFASKEPAKFAKIGSLLADGVAKVAFIAQATGKVAKAIAIILTLLLGVYYIYKDIYDETIFETIKRKVGANVEEQQNDLISKIKSTFGIN